MTTRPRGVSFPARREDDGAAGQCLDSAGAVDHFEFRIVKRVMGAGEEANTLSLSHTRAIRSRLHAVLSLSLTHTRHPIPTARGPSPRWGHRSRVLWPPACPPTCVLGARLSSSTQARGRGMAAWVRFLLCYHVIR